MKTINYKSDFDFIMKLVSCVKTADGTCEKREVGWPEHDWTARLYTSNKSNAYIVSRKGDVLTNCFNDNGRIHVVCNNHRLGKGRLQCEFHAEIPNGLYPDGIEDLYEPQLLDIELVAGQGDCATQAEVDLILPYIKGDRGAAFTYSDFTSEQKVELIAPIKESIDKAITDKQDKLRVTADFDLSENLLSLTEAGKTALFDSMWASIGGTKLDNGSYRMGATGKELTIEEAMVRYERNWFIDWWNIICRYWWKETHITVTVGGYNEATGYFELNGIKDITYDQALEIAKTYQPRTHYDNTYTYGNRGRVRTLFPVELYPWDAQDYQAAFMGCNYLEKVSFRSNLQIEDSLIIRSADNMFAGCNRLEVIEGAIISFSGANSGITYRMFAGCFKLREIKIASKFSLDFSASPLLSLDSIEYMIAHGSAGITLTFHPDAYSRIPDELHALAEEKQIILAST